MVDAAVTAIRERGNANVGDKTMLDTIVPWAEALKKAAAEGKPLAEALSAALPDAERGMLNTRQMVSKIGRASCLGGRTKGLQDPGATACYLMIRSFTEHVTASS